jgi:predicted ribosome quality control (RQC) complex YloA/Tae2 family protein
MKLLMFDTIYTIQIGQNQNENDLLLKEAKEDYTWFHLSDYSSPHLIININFENLTKEQIYRIACLLKNNTKYKKENHVSIDYTLRRNLKLTEIPGQVLFKNSKFKTICV